MDKPRQITALTATTKDGKTHTWKFADYPNSLLCHAYCVARLSDIQPDDVTGTGWIYEDGDAIMIPHRWDPRSVRRVCSEPHDPTFTERQEAYRLAHPDEDLPF